MASADDIVPDEKDWTWTLERACPECGFAAAECQPGEVANLLRLIASRWPDRLTATDAASRPRPGTWSPLEYGCHVRDCCAVFAERLRLMLDEDDPLFPNCDQDRAATEADYAAAEPESVARELVSNAEVFAARLDSVLGQAWQRTGRRSNGSSFTVETLTQYFAHDLVHHAWDVGLSAVS